MGLSSGLEGRVARRDLDDSVEAVLDVVALALQVVERLLDSRRDGTAATVPAPCLHVRVRVGVGVRVGLGLGLGLGLVFGFGFGSRFGLGLGFGCGCGFGFMSRESAAGRKVTSMLPSSLGCRNRFG